MLAPVPIPITNVKNSTLVRALAKFFLPLAAAVLAACSGGEPQAVIPKPAEPILQASETTKSAAEREATMARLARQEAAARMTDKLDEKPARAAENPQPAPQAAPRDPEPKPRVSEPKARAPEPQPRAAPVSQAQAPAAAQPAARPAVLDASSRESLALLPSPGFVERSEAAKAEPAKAEPAKAERPVQVAAAAPARPAAPARVLSRVEPDFPRAAFQARVDRGLVKARLTLDGGGNVTRVDIVDAKPHRVFDNAVVAALTQWKFNDGASGRTYETEVVFQR